MSYTKTVSVIISCRNEDQNIQKIISCLQRQRFDKNKLELIFINDHSEDKTLELLEKEQQNCSYIQVINLKDSIKGKKNAIKEGKSSNGMRREKNRRRKRKDKRI